MFTDTGKITAVIFTSSSSGVLFILSQWNRKTITIQSTRRSICHTTSSGETMPDMTVDQRDLSNRGCHALVATTSDTSFVMESPFHSDEEIWQPLNMIRKRKNTGTVYHLVLRNRRELLNRSNLHELER